MKTIWTIAKKEYEHYFISPIAYAVGLMIMGILGFIFYNNVVYAISNQICSANFSRDQSFGHTLPFHHTSNHHASYR